MPRIAGVDVPGNKRSKIALTYKVGKADASGGRVRAADAAARSRLGPTVSQRLGSSCAAHLVTSQCCVAHLASTSPRTTRGRAVRCLMREHVHARGVSL